MNAPKQQYNQPQHQAKSPQNNENNNLFVDWITGTKTIDNNFIDKASSYANTLLPKRNDNEIDKNKALSTSKLRKFFGKLRKIEAEGLDFNNKVPLILLRAQLAYDAKRDGKAATLDFQEKIDACLKTVCDAKNEEQYNMYFKNFMHVLEAIVAYHKYHGGEDK